MSQLDNTNNTICKIKAQKITNSVAETLVCFDCDIPLGLNAKSEIYESVLKILKEDIEY